MSARSHDDVGGRHVPTRILAILPLLGDPRHSKRISMLQEYGFAVQVAAFERDSHSGRMPDCPAESLGKIAHGRYLQRIPRILAALPALRRAMKRSHAAYAFGPDMALMALVAGLGLGRPVVVETADIREVQVAPGLMGRLVRMIDRCLVNSCSLLVATTPAFIEVYYRRWLRASVPAMVIENKVESSFAQEMIAEGIKSSLAGRPLRDRPLRIGYFGNLRCEWSWRVLKGFAESRPRDVEVVLAGFPMNPVDLPQQAARYDNIEYLGEFRSPQDLPALYSSVDLVWACYQPLGPNDWNLRWARPNRFYESCLFQVPIISRAGSCDAVDVARYGIGLIIEDEDVVAVVDRLCSIVPDDLETWKHNMAMLPRKVYMYTSEACTLGGALERIAGRCS